MRNAWKDFPSYIQTILSVLKRVHCCCLFRVVPGGIPTLIFGWIPGRIHGVIPGKISGWFSWEIYRASFGEVIEKLSERFYDGGDFNHWGESWRNSSGGINGDNPCRVARNKFHHNIFLSGSPQYVARSRQVNLNKIRSEYNIFSSAIITSGRSIHKHMPNG